MFSFNIELLSAYLKDDNTLVIVTPHGDLLYHIVSDDTKHILDWFNSRAQQGLESNAFKQIHVSHGSDSTLSFLDTGPEPPETIVLHLAPTISVSQMRDSISFATEISSVYLNSFTKETYHD